MEQTLLILVRGLPKDKFQHKVICTWKGGAIAEALEEEGVEIFSVGSFKSPFEFKKLNEVVKITKSYNPHLIHGAVFEGMTMATVAGLFSLKSKVILEETSDPQNRSKKANLLLKAFSFRANAFQAISEEVGDYLVKKTKVNNQKVRIIPNGVEVPEILSQEDKLNLREKYGLSKNDFVVGFVGRLYNDHKRFTDLVEAIYILGNREIKLLIVGDGKDRELLNIEAKRLNLSSQIIQVGYQSNPHAFYDLMNVLCIPSSREGFGLVAVEGMFHRLPLIVSAVGGLKGIVKNGITGLHVNPKSPTELSKAVDQLFSSPMLCQDMGRGGYQRALKNYSSEKYIEMLEDFYSEILERDRWGMK